MARFWAGEQESAERTLTGGHERVVLFLIRRKRFVTQALVRYQADDFAQFVNLNQKFKKVFKLDVGFVVMRRITKLPALFVLLASHWPSLTKTFKFHLFLTYIYPCYATCLPPKFAPFFVIPFHIYALNPIPSPRTAPPIGSLLYNGYHGVKVKVPLAVPYGAQNFYWPQQPNRAGFRGRNWQCTRDTRLMYHQKIASHQSLVSRIYSAASSSGNIWKHRGADLQIRQTQPPDL